MVNNESLLLEKALLFEEGHLRRTRHILTVYSLCRLIGGGEQLSRGTRQIIQAAAILHDIAIGPCKKKYGSATQEQQQKMAPAIVSNFLKQCEYLPSARKRILKLVLTHHDYRPYQGMDHQVLMEADLIAGCYEADCPEEQFRKIKPLFLTNTGMQLLNTYLS